MRLAFAVVVLSAAAPALAVDGTAHVAAPAAGKLRAAFVQLDRTSVRSGGRIRMRVVPPKGRRAQFGVSALLRRRDAEQWSPPLFVLVFGIPGVARPWIPYDENLKTILVLLNRTRWFWVQLPPVAPGTYRMDVGLIGGGGESRPFTVTAGP